jgi:hypothetical protein
MNEGNSDSTITRADVDRSSQHIYSRPSPNHCDGLCTWKSNACEDHKILPEMEIAAFSTEAFVGHVLHF